MLLIAYGLVQGYGYTVIVSATPDSPIFPLEATVHTAAVKEYHLFDTQFDRLPQGIQFVCADTGFDTHLCSDRVELAEDGHSTGRRFLCPARRSSTDLPRKTARTQREHQRHLHHQNQQAFLKTRRGRRLHSRRRCTVEPFHEELKSLFELQERLAPRTRQKPHPTPRSLELQAPKETQLNLDTLRHPLNFKTPSVI